MIGRGTISWTSKVWIGFIAAAAILIDVTLTLSKLREWQPEKYNDHWYMAQGGITIEQANFIFAHPVIHNTCYFALFFVIFGAVITTTISLTVFWVAAAQEIIFMLKINKKHKHSHARQKPYTGV